MIAMAVMSNAACATISMGSRHVTAKMAPKTSPTMKACSTANPLVRVVDDAEPRGCDEDDRDHRDASATEKFAEAFEEVAAKRDLFAHARADYDEKEHARQRRAIPDKKMIRVINWIGSEERHDDRLHDQLERHAEDNAERNCSRPTTRLD